MGEIGGGCWPVVLFGDCVEQDEFEPLPCSCSLFRSCICVKFLNKHSSSEDSS